jgi:hypothetical protein
MGKWIVLHDLRHSPGARTSISAGFLFPLTPSAQVLTVELNFRPGSRPGTGDAGPSRRDIL